jgi:hypothetical protein
MYITNPSLLAEFFDLDNQIVFCSKPPACVLFRPDNPKHPGFQGLDWDIFPIFPIERSIQIKGFSIRRKQIPMCPAFCLTDYKVQGKTLSTAVLDLKNDPHASGQDTHKKFCSLYVQLSRLKSFNGLHLLQPIELTDLAFHPYSGLLTEMERLREIEQETLSSWSGHSLRQQKILTDSQKPLTFSN